MQNCSKSPYSETQNCVMTPLSLYMQNNSFDPHYKIALSNSCHMQFMTFMSLNLWRRRRKRNTGSTPCTLSSLLWGFQCPRQDLVLSFICLQPQDSNVKWVSFLSFPFLSLIYSLYLFKFFGEGMGVGLIKLVERIDMIQWISSFVCASQSVYIYYR